MGSTDLSAGLVQLVPVGGASGFSAVRCRFPRVFDPDPASWEIAGDELHIRQVALDLSPGEIDELWRLLSSDEGVRADRFHFERDRRRYVAARGTLRLILSRYTGIDPERLRFGYGPQGKPVLGFPAGDLCFNLSHSEEVAVYAVSRGRAVGIDVERVRPWPEAGALVESYFTPRERDAFRALPAGEKDDAFFRWWTRKEAYIKALGTGHAHPLDDIDVLDGLESPQWLLWDVEALPGFRAAVAMGAR